MRKWDWFIPITPPTIAFRPAINIITYENLYVMIKDIIEIGASFCQVDNRRADIQEIDVITDGYHRWQGAIPILSVRAIRRISVIKLLGVLSLNHNDILLIKSMLDPRAWVRKYFTDASVSWYLFEDKIRGINLNRFNSKDIHKKSQFVLERAINLLNIRDDRVRKMNG